MPLKILHFGACRIGLKKNKTECLNALANIISSKKGQVPDENDKLTEYDIVYFLRQGHRKDKGKKVISSAVRDMYKEFNPVSPLTIVNIRENYSGTRLIDQMRKHFPGIIPSKSEENKVLKSSFEEFFAVLLPKRTSTGWRIEPNHLFEVMLHRYPFLEEDIHIRIQGDARRIGGRHHTNIGMSFVNNELKLWDLSYQNPKRSLSYCAFL